MYGDLTLNEQSRRLAIDHQDKQYAIYHGSIRRGASPKQSWLVMIEKNFFFGNNLIHVLRYNLQDKYKRYCSHFREPKEMVKESSAKRTKSDNLDREETVINVEKQVTIRFEIWFLISTKNLNFLYLRRPLTKPIPAPRKLSLVPPPI